VAGDDRLPVLPAGRCEQRIVDERAYRACTVQRGGVSVTLATSATGLERHLGTLLWAALVGIAVGAIGGTAASVWVSRWALAPLRRLRDRVRAVPADGPDASGMREPLGYAEIDELQGALAWLLTRLGASLAHAQRFALDAAHELRTPLTTIAGELELMTEREGEATPEMLARVRRQVNELVDLVQRLLVLATPASPAAPGGEAVDLADVAEQVTAALSPLHRERVALDLDEDVLVRGDAVLLAAAVRNGVDNAIKFSSTPVVLRVRGEGGEARFEVEDEGPGMMPHERVHAFEPFFRTPAARAGKSGHGIGLALVSHVAAGHGGRAELADTSTGTCLRIVLPRWRLA
jgi:two-component system, OmpR family, sensor kinase